MYLVVKSENPKELFEIVNDIEKFSHTRFSVVDMLLGGKDYFVGMISQDKDYSLIVHVTSDDVAVSADGELLIGDYIYTADGTLLLLDGEDVRVIKRGFYCDAELAFALANCVSIQMSNRKKIEERRATK